MKPFVAVIAFALVGLSSAEPQRRQRQRNGRQQAPALYGVPDEEPQPSYGVQADASTLSESHSGDHQGLDWLLESVPGQPGTDYPIYGQEALPDFGFDCNGQVEGGYYADTASDCQVFHVCVPDGLGGLGTQSFLCPNGTIFNQEYFICDWWFNFDCSQAQGLYSRNDEVAAERDSATLAQASNVQNTYSQPTGNTYNAAPAQDSYAPAQASYGSGKRK